MKSEGIVVTGANGYLGGAVCRYFEGRTRVLALARSLDKLKSFEGSEIETATYEDLADRVRQGDVFIHCAAKTSHRGEYGDFLATNVEWTLDLFDRVRDRISLFLFISSVAAAGYSNRPDSDLLTEESAPLLLEGEFYGRTKWLAETRLHEIAAASNARSVVLRPGLIYEPKRLTRRQTWLDRGSIVDPLERVPLIHLSNFLDAIEGVVSHDEVEGTFFVVDDEQPTRRTLNDLQIRNGLLRYHPWRVGRTGKVLRSLLSNLGSLVSGDPLRNRHDALRADLALWGRRMRYDTSSLRNATGWVPKIGLEEGLRG